MNVKHVNFILAMTQIMGIIRVYRFSTNEYVTSHLKKRIAIDYETMKRINLVNDLKQTRTDD